MILNGVCKGVEFKRHLTVAYSVIYFIHEYTNRNLSVT